MKKTFFRLWIIAAVLFISACGSASSEGAGESSSTLDLTDDTILIGANTDGYPQAFTEDGELTGFSVDMAEAIFGEAGYHVEWHLADWNGLLASLATGKIDTMGNFAYTPERGETYNFTAPYFYTRTGLAVAEKNTSINDVEDLQGETVINILGSNYGNTLNEALPEGYLEIQTLLNLPIGVQMVNSGKSTAIVQGYETLLAQVNDRNLPLRVLDETFSEREAAFPFRKIDEYEPVIEDVDEAVQTLREDGTLAEISTKWFGQDITESNN